MLKTEWMMDNHLIMDANMFDQLNRKVSILDIDVGEQDLILRADLDVPLSQFIPPPPLEDQFKSIMEQEENTLSGDTKQRSRLNKKKKTKQQIAEEAE